MYSWLIINIYVHRACIYRQMLVATLDFLRNVFSSSFCIYSVLSLLLLSPLAPSAQHKLVKFVFDRRETVNIIDTQQMTTMTCYMSIRRSNWVSVNFFSMGYSQTNIYVAYKSPIFWLIMILCVNQHHIPCSAAPKLKFNNK